MNRADINKRLKRTNIKGRDYIEVNQRILAFWELYPNGRITTELLADDGKRCTFKASVYDGDNLLATGHSFEFQGAGMVNKTSYVENCETSAVGRALGMLGSESPRASHRLMKFRPQLSIKNATRNR